MNNTLSISRMYHLFVNDMHLNYKKYLMICGSALVCIILILMLACNSTYTHNIHTNWQGEITDPMWGTEQAIFYMGLFILGCVAAGNIFQPLANKPSRIATLMLPATNFDKFVVRWFIMVPIFVALYVGCFYLLDALRVYFLDIIRPFNADVMPIKWKLICFADTPDQMVAVNFIISLFLVLQSFFCLGSAIWPKRGVIGTGVSLFLIVAILTLIWSILIRFLFDFSTYCYGTTLEDALPNNGDKHFWSVTFSIIFYAGAFIICAFNYTLAYFRFKEIEVIQRW